MALNFSIHDKHILIVDDSAVNILLIEAILEEFGFHNLSSASSASEAYLLLEKEEINIILMDIMMPDIDGLEALQTIKSNPKYSHIPIIMVTATGNDELLKKSFDLGAVDFVRKPVNQVELIARLNSVLKDQEKDAVIMQHARLSTIEDTVSTLAHQWRQPLGTITAVVGRLQISKELDTLTDEELDAGLEKLNTYANNLSQMITTFRKHISTDTSTTLTSPNTAILEVDIFVRESLQRKNISLLLYLDDLPAVSYCQNLLVQVITSIITNATEAFESNKIEKPVIRIHSSILNNKINILIEDNAGGIPSDVIGKVFEPYFSTKKEKNGKGLGLYMVKKIMTKQLHGNIVATSKDEKSEFLITFPAD